MNVFANGVGFGGVLRELISYFKKSVFGKKL